MQRTQSRLRKINIYAPSAEDSGYVGKKVIPALVGYVYAEVFPERTSLSDERGGMSVSRSATLVLRRDAGVKCGDYMGIYGDAPDSRVVDTAVYPGHLTVRTESV